MAERQRRDEVALVSCHDFRSRRKIAQIYCNLIGIDHDLLGNVFNRFALFLVFTRRPVPAQCAFCWQAAWTTGRFAQSFLSHKAKAFSRSTSCSVDKFVTFRAPKKHKVQQLSSSRPQQIQHKAVTNYKNLQISIMLQIWFASRGSPVRSRPCPPILMLMCQCVTDI
jgi:hypothetical protein